MVVETTGDAPGDFVAARWWGFRANLEQKAPFAPPGTVVPARWADLPLRVRGKYL